MESGRFDDLLRKLAQSRSRRATIGAALTGLFGAGSLALLGGDAGAKKKHKKKHKHKHKPSGGCASGITRCGEDCVDTDTDAANCGNCGHSCPTGQRCAGGHCQCPAGQRDCGGSCAACCPDDECCDDADCDDGNICTTDRCQDGTCAQSPAVGADCGEATHAQNSVCQTNGTCAIGCNEDEDCSFGGAPGCICQPDATGNQKHCRVVAPTCEGRQPCASTAECPLGKICQFTSACNQTVCVDACIW